MAKQTGNISREPAGEPGRRMASRVSGINGGRFFGEGDGNRDHSERTSERERENTGMTPVASNPDCIADVMARGSERLYTPGGREQVAYNPIRGPGYLKNRDGTDAEISRETVADAAAAPRIRARRQAEFDKMMQGPPVERVEERSTGTRPPM